MLNRLKKLYSSYNSPERKRERRNERLYDFYRGQKPPASLRERNMYIIGRLSQKAVTAVLTAVFTLFLILILICTIVGSVITVYILNLTNNVKAIELREPEHNYSTNVYTYNKKNAEYELAYRIRPASHDMFIKTDFDALPDYVKYAFVCIEDERFYSHDGVDYKRTGAAIFYLALSYLNMSDTYFGGSTITQQLIKNVTGENEDTPERKMKEIFSAMKLEKRYTKDEILESYLDEIYFDEIDGYYLYGIEAASIGYFGKSAKDLTIAEAATLAAIPKSPNYFNPSINYEENKERRETCLMKMFELGVISAQEYEEAMNQHVMISNSDEFSVLFPEAEKLSSEDEEFENPDVNSDAIDLAVMQFCDYLEEKYELESSDDALNMFKTGGYSLYLSVDSDVQEYLENKYADWYSYFPQEYSDIGERVQSACVVMNYDGLVQGIIGRIGNKSDSLIWNNAYKAHRQCGSTIKPISTYGYALENDKITWSTMFDDTALPAGVACPEEWPQNYDGDPTGMTRPVNYFLKRSINTLPAQLCNLYSLRNIYEFATERMHLELDPVADVTYSSLAIGGTSTGPTLLNLTNAYIPYGNGGTYYEASIIRKAVDRHTNEILINNEFREGEQAVSEETAFVMNKLLQNNVIGENGTGRAAKLKKKEIGGKTGTTENWKDIAFIGLTPDFVSGVWIGYENGENPEAIENASSAKIWYNVFGKFADSYESDAAFPKCGSVIYSRYCSYTGLLATPDCPGTEYGYYKSTNCDFCDVHGSGGSYVSRYEEEEEPEETERPAETAPNGMNVIYETPVTEALPYITLPPEEVNRPQR